jgi:hypothetical protein
MKDTICIYCYKLKKLVNINEIRETLMFFSQFEAKNIYGNREVDFVIKYHMDVFSFQNFSYENVNYYDDIMKLLTDEGDDFL